MIMKNWRTTTSGVISGTGMLIIYFFPEYTKIGGFLASFGTMLGHAFAADGKCLDPDCPKNQTPQTIMKIIILFFSMSALLAGCSYLRSTTETAEGVTTSVRAFTLFDGHSDLAK